MYVTAFHAEFPVAFHVIPGQDAAERLFSLAVLEVGCISIVGRQHRKFPVGVDIPGVQPETVAFPGIVIHFLKQMQVLERPGAVALFRVILSDDVLILVVDVYLFVVVGVLVIVRRGRIDRTGGDVPPLTSVGEAGELIEGLERADALHVLGVEPFSDFRSRAEFDQTAQSTARFVHR